MMAEKNDIKIFCDSIENQVLEMIEEMVPEYLDKLEKDEEKNWLMRAFGEIE